jgi:hypothetical protein
MRNRKDTKVVDCNGYLASLERCGCTPNEEALEEKKRDS